MPENTQSTAAGPDAPAPALAVQTPGPGAAWGVALAMTAFAWWGAVFPLYLTKLNELVGRPTSASFNYGIEVVAHRVIWACLLCLGVLAVQRKLGRVVALVTNPKSLAVMAASGLLIGINWLAFVFAVSQDRLSEASLGYYICPLFSVLLGVVAFRERLSPLQTLSILIAAIGVGIEWYSTGSVPIIALSVSISFALYGMIRKRAKAGPLDGLAVEAGLIGPLALAFVLWKAFGPATTETVTDASGIEPSAAPYTLQFGTTWAITVMFLISGFMTALPLTLFAASTKRLRLSTLGFLQFSGPTIQFAVSVLIFKEAAATTPTRLLVFTLIWIGVGLFIADALITSRKTAKAQRSP
ncbi:MAG: EamA family transporter RarD [Planctomycetota bacterium]